MYKYVMGPIAVDMLNYDTLVEQVNNSIHRKEHAAIYFANAHMFMEAYDSKNLSSVINECKYVVTDGMPLVWLANLLFNKRFTRVYGPTAMLHLLKLADEKRYKIALYGSSNEVIIQIVSKIHQFYPNICIVYFHSPAYGSIDSDEHKNEAEKIKHSDAQILFVGLGCPKQELWIAKYCQDTSMICAAVGAGFDFFAGTVPQAPSKMQKMGLEWLFRLIKEPRRLFKRYFKHNPRFLLISIILITKRRFSDRRA